MDVVLRYARDTGLPLGEVEVDLKGVVQVLGGLYAGTWWTVELDSTVRDPGAMARQNRRVLDALVG